MGSNGLRPQVRAMKCATPEKRKYHTFDSAWDAARAASLRASIEIVAYLCADCGSYHLTRKVDGSDVAVTTNEDGVSTGALRKNSPKYEFTPPERVALPKPITLTEQGQVKLEVLKEYLKDRDTVTSSQICEVLDIKSYSSTSKYLRSAGWVSSGRGRSAYWTKPGVEVKPIVSIAPKPKPPVTRSIDMAQVDAAIARHPSSQGASWRPVNYEKFSITMTLSTLVEVYESAGLEVRLQVREKG